jgi:hypothetical protein
MRKFAGIDVSKSTVTACVFDQDGVPDDLERYWRDNEGFKFSADKQGLAALLELDFEVAIMEPTGGHYSRIWAHHLIAAGREVRWVAHDTIHAHRKSHRLPSKQDWSDAVALASYGIRWAHLPRRFVDNSGGRLRELSHELVFLRKRRIPVTNRLRQQLAHEWPEQAAASLWPSAYGKSKQTKIVRAIATGIYPAALERSRVESIGLPISSTSQRLAQQLLHLADIEEALEIEVTEALRAPEIQPYAAVLGRWAMGERSQAVILSRVLPLGRILGPDGKPVVERVGPKKAKRKRSLGSFKLLCGLGMVQYQSGDHDGLIPGGSTDARTALWQWIKTAVVMKPDLDNPNIRALREFYDSGSSYEEKGVTYKVEATKGNQRILKVARRGLEAIFYELVQVHQQQ